MPSPNLQLRGSRACPDSDHNLPRRRSNNHRYRGHDSWFLLGTLRRALYCIHAIPPSKCQPGPELPIPPKTEEEETTAGLPRRILVELKERRQSPAVGMGKLEIGKDYVLCIAEKQEIGWWREGTKRELWESGFWKNEKWLKMRMPPILVNEAKEVKFHVEMGQEDTARKEEDQIQRRLEMLSTREGRSKGRVTARSRNEHYAASSG